MVKLLKYITPLNLKLFLVSFKQNGNVHGNLKSNKPKIYVVLSADYGNLGDVAISYAQYKFIKDKFIDYEVIDVPISQNIKNIRIIKKNIKEKDIITIVGGGNLSDKYPDIEHCRLQWINNFPKNKIISFPQTIDFKEKISSNKLFLKSKKVYESHNDFHLILREKKSYSLVKDNLKVKAYICPDIVTSLNETIPSVERVGIMTCIRSDKESILAPTFREGLKDKLKLKFKNIKFSDTHIPRNNLTFNERKEQLDEIWTNFRSVKVVITDRLHGMIFSYITKTPCVVISNSNHKIIETYNNWLSGCNFISLIRDVTEENIINEAEKLMSIGDKTIKSKVSHSIIEEIIK